MSALHLFTATATTLFLLLYSATISAAATVGVTYRPSNPNLPPTEQVVSSLQSLRISAVRLIDPTPASVRAFAYTDISLFLSAPNHLIPSFAGNRSTAALWLFSHVLPYVKHTRISLISAGSDATAAATSDPTAVLAAIQNLHLALHDFGIRTISVSTTFSSFTEIITPPIPFRPDAKFLEPISSSIIHPLLQFLAATNSPFLINLYPHNIYRINAQLPLPLEFALFQEQYPYYTTGGRYQNLLHMMVDAVNSAIAAFGQHNVTVVVAETGWPRETEIGSETEMYLNGLVRHSTKEEGVGEGYYVGVAEAYYIYQLFDDEEDSHMQWGIMHPNMTMKYDLDFSGSNSTRVIGDHNIYAVPDERNRDISAPGERNRKISAGHKDLKISAKYKRHLLRLLIMVWWGLQFMFFWRIFIASWRFQQRLLGL